MASFPRCGAALLWLLCACGLGCDNVKLRSQASNSQQEEQGAKPPIAAPRQASSAKKQEPEAEPSTIDEELIPLDEDSGFDFSFSGTGSGSVGIVQHEHPGLEKSAAAEMVLRLVRESVDYRPTLVVWLIDQSRSVQAISTELRGLISNPYGGFTGLGSTSSGNSSDTPLLTAVCSFGESIGFPLDPPSSDPQQLAVAFDAIGLDESGKEMTFTAIQTCLDKYLTYRTEQRREVIFVMITDEAGDDQDLVEQLAPTPRRYGIPLYVLGVPAPFGRDAAMDQTTEAPFDYEEGGDWQPIRQGPESLYPERIQLGFCRGGVELELIDSGFGPFALEYLCQASGGRFLALRPAADSSSLSSSVDWPSSAVYNFAPEAMRRYAPDYVSTAEYQQLLADNSARQALFQATRLTGLEMVEFARLEFEKTSEPELARQLSLAQQSAAKLEPAVNRLHETLERGESDRERLTRPRWQAAYDLALGRATAAKARIDGYNAMLAALKRGKDFEHQSSNTWVLEPAETIEASSALRRLVEKAGTYLQRVVDEHPGTPWAALAQHELDTRAGWKWTEK